ncbi:MAG: glycosyltransferase family 39 protein [Planctomycetota bacterium]|nr:glycosyltransferase family 39 protein [Planctomycetota bacterium]
MNRRTPEEPERAIMMGGTLARLVLGVMCVAVFSTALVFRLIDLGHLPGINGDEAYYGALVLELEAGRNVPLRTASGLPLNPFYSGPLLLLHIASPTPSFVVLRLVAVLSGVLAVILAYRLLSRVFDRLTGLLTSLLLACVPIAIAYSRFGWDQSQAPLATLICLYFSLRRQTRAALWACLALVIVHPANVLLTPILLGPSVAELVLVWYRTAPGERWQLSTRVLGGRRALVISAVLLLALCGVALWLLERLQSGPLQRLFAIDGWCDFAPLWGDLLSGVTIYRYVCGPLLDFVVWRERLVFCAIWLVLLAVGVPRLVRRQDTRTLGLLGGLAPSLIAFYLVGGAAAMGPGQERYAMYLVTPSCLVLALLVRRLGDTKVASGWQLGGVLVICSLLLVSFYQQYFMVFWQTGGLAHRTFRTGPVEPKQAAFEYIRAAAAQLLTLG